MWPYCTYLSLYTSEKRIRKDDKLSSAYETDTENPELPQVTSNPYTEGDA